MAGCGLTDQCTLTIPARCKENILKELRLLNITRETLFPGLDASADAVTERYSQRRQQNGS